MIGCITIQNYGDLSGIVFIIWMFQAFNEKNPNQSTNKENILLAYSFSENEYACNVTIDGKHTWEVKMAYNGTAENKHFNGTSYFIVSGRNSDGNVEHVFQNAERNPMKTQTIRNVLLSMCTLPAMYSL